ncbi:MAG TPA: signal peptidase I [Trebonia sp.]|nr:signal peptidase I [Trebonia sp.]
MNGRESNEFNPWAPPSAPGTQAAAAPVPGPRRRRPWLVVYWVTFGLLCAAFAGLLAGVFMTLGTVTVPSLSMSPTIPAGSTVAYQRGASGVERGDIVLVQVPHVGLLARRVIALPGDHLTCCTTKGQLTVNGKALAEDYLAPTPYWQTPVKVTVPPGNVWVMGDNRGDAADSREWGPLARGDITGRVVLVSDGGRRTLLKTPATFTADGLAPADHRVPLPFLLLGLAIVAAILAAIDGVTGLIVWLVRRGRRRRAQQPVAW